jgi:deazaflavin-dependent oxidoreductase (nitroreductase family)
MSILGQVLNVHDKVYKATGGRIGHRVLGGMPAMLLHTTGRKSGAERTTSLTYAKDGNDYLLVASNGGSDRPPAWLLNLRGNPSVEVQVARNRGPATARIVEPSDPDYPRLWKIVNDNNGNRYTAYQEHTARPIPVVVLTPP